MFYDIALLVDEQVCGVPYIVMFGGPLCCVLLYYVTEVLFVVGRAQYVTIMI